jgi:hypothetical protein
MPITMLSCKSTKKWSNSRTLTLPMLPPDGVTSGNHVSWEVNTPSHSPLPQSLLMSSLHLTRMVVRLCGKLALMAHSKRELESTRHGTNCLHVVNSTLMNLSTINSVVNMNISIGNFLIVLVLVQVQTQVYPSHSSFSSSGRPLLLLISFSALAFPMPTEKGKPKRRPT